MTSPWTVVNQLRNLSRSVLGPEARSAYADSARILEEWIAVEDASAADVREEVAAFVESVRVHDFGAEPLDRESLVKWIARRIRGWSR